VNNIPITAEVSKMLWEILLSGKSNVFVEVSDAPSPVTIAYDSIMPETTPYPPGTQIFLGASVKGGDIKRYSGALRKASPELKVEDPLEYAAEASTLPGAFLEKLKLTKYYESLPSVLKGKNPLEYSASDLRYLLEFADEDQDALDLAAFYVGQNINAYVSILSQ